jgi:hypothetical protein
MVSCLMMRVIGFVRGVDRSGGFKMERAYGVDGCSLYKLENLFGS